MRSSEKIQDEIAKEIRNATTALNGGISLGEIEQLNNIDDLLDLFQSTLPGSLESLFEELQESKAYEYDEIRASDESDYKHATGY